MPAPRDPEKREEWRNRKGQFLHGHIPWNKDKPFLVATKNPMWGKRHSEETKIKMREKKKGAKNPMYGRSHTEETKNRMSELGKGSKNSMWGKHLPDTAKKKISEANKGRIPWHKGQTGIFSKETLKRMSDSQKGRIKSEEERMKLSKALKGHVLSEETKRKLSEACKGKKLSEATKKKISIAGRGKQVGSQNPNWRGGISLLQKAIRASTTFQLWRQAVFHKDRFQCQDCGKIGGYLHSHHIYPFRKLLKDYKIVSLGQAIRTEELWDINNGITLCIPCHKKRHKKRSQTLEEIENSVGDRDQTRGY